MQWARETLQSRESKLVGQLWRERLVTDANAQHQSALAICALLATRLDAFPKPRPYCPDILVGTWEQTEPFHARWQLGAGGELAIAVEPDGDPSGRLAEAHAVGDRR